MAAPPPPVVLRGGTVLVLVAVAVQTALHTVNRLLDLSGRLDVNGEWTVFSVLSTAVLLLASAGALLVGRRLDRARRLLDDGRLLLLGVSGVLAFFAVDELLALHERVGVRAGALVGLSSSWDSVLWPMLYLPLAGSVAVVLWRVVRRAPRGVATLVRTGLVLLAVSVVLEVLSAPFSTSETAAGTVHAVEGAVEEGLELGGWGLIATALLGWAASQRQGRRTGA